MTSSHEQLRPRLTILQCTSSSRRRRRPHITTIRSLLSSYPENPSTHARKIKITGEESRLNDLIATLVHYPFNILLIQVTNQEPLVGMILQLSGDEVICHNINGKMVGVACDTRQIAIWLSVTTK